MYTIISIWFYAQKDTKTPMFVSIFTISLNITLAIALSRPKSYGVSGLAMAQSIVAVTEVSILTTIMIWRDKKLLNAVFWGGVWRIISVTGFSVVASFIMISLFPLGLHDKGIVTLGSKLFFISAVTFIVHIAVSALFDLEEVRPVISRIRKIVLQPVKVDI
jgi:peptidoglycan biosynthesis protein MviN/MurJ (putative lipid II flippase)